MEYRVLLFTEFEEISRLQHYSKCTNSKQFTYYSQMGSLEQVTNVGGSEPASWSAREPCWAADNTRWEVGVVLERGLAGRSE